MVDTNPVDDLAQAFSELVPDNSEQKPTEEAGNKAEESEATPLEDGDNTEGAEENSEDVEVTEDGEDEADNGDEETEETHTVTVNGEDIAVTTSELKAGYMKDADYRRKTAELSTQRKEVEADRERFTKGFQSLLTQFDVADQLIRETSLNITDEQLDQLAMTDAAEYTRISRIKEKAERRLKALMHEKQQANQVYLENQRALVENERVKERAALEREAPEFRKKETWDKLTDYLKGEQLGFTDEVLNSITDRRFAKLADKARRYDEYVAKGKLNQAKVAAKVIKPKAANLGAPSTTNNEAMQRVMSKALTGDKSVAMALMDYL
jgi:soluble cytochrome b562